MTRFVFVCWGISCSLGNKYDSNYFGSFVESRISSLTLLLTDFNFNCLFVVFKILRNRLKIILIIVVFLWTGVSTINKTNIKSVVAMGVTALMLGRLFPLLTVISFKCVGTLPPPQYQNCSYGYQKLPPLPRKWCIIIQSPKSSFHFLSVFYYSSDHRTLCNSVCHLKIFSINRK